MSEARSINLADWRDVAIRAIKTAIQVFGGIVAANVIGWTDITGLKVAALAGASAGISVVWNAVLSWSRTT